MKATWLATFALATVGTAAQPGLHEPTAADRVLVVSPHPDDESLCCAGLLLRAEDAGAQVGVVWVTAGDGSSLWAWKARLTLHAASSRMLRFGNQRIAEADAAADVLGVPEAHRYFLGYPDGGIDKLLKSDPERPVRARFTRRETIPYGAALSTGVLMTGAQLEQDFARVLADFQPTMVLVPAAADRHPDHSGSGLLAARMLEATGSSATLACYIIHDGLHWPAPQGLKPDLPLRAGRDVQNLDWTSFDLTPRQRQLKADALRAHRSQMRTMSRFLYAFVRSNELFASSPCSETDGPGAPPQVP